MLTVIAWLSVTVAIVSALWITADELRHPQKMAVMNVVWPVTALYFSLFAVVAYYRWGRAEQTHAQSDDLAASQVAVGTSHCGAGCMLADIGCEFGIAALGITLLGSVLWAEYAIDFLAAWLLGILFQYWAIKPMQPSMTRSQAIIAAIKADTLSILAFQIGMYAWMALVFFRLFPAPHLTPFRIEYWLMMQIGMICGYATAFPMNWFLIKAGLKEAM